MSISETRYVDITSGVGGESVLAQRALVARIFTANQLVPPATFISFTSAQAVGEYFGTVSEEYLRALFYFSFVSKIITRPQSIQFARWVNTDSAPRIASIPGNGTLLSSWTAIGNGSFGITMNDEIAVLSGLDFQAAASLAAVASIIQAAIRSQFAVQQTGSLTSASTTVSGLTDTALLSVGMSVNGAGIPALTTISSITNATTIVISNAAAGTIQTGTLTSGDDTVTGLADTSVLVAGMKVTGTGIPALTTILSITNATTIVLSANATATGAQPLSFIAATTPLTFYTTANANFATSTVTYDDKGGFVFLGGEVGEGTPNNLSVQSGLVGVDITSQSLLGWLPPAQFDNLGNYTAGAIYSLGADAQTITELLANSSGLSNNFGSFLFLNNLNLTLADAILAAAWNITQNNTYMFCAPVTRVNASAWASNVGGLGTYAGTALTLSGANISMTGTLNAPSNVISGLSSVAGISAGMSVSGTGIAAGTTIIAVTETPTKTAIMSQPAIGAGAQIITFVLNQFPEQIPMMVLAATDFTLVNSAQNYMFQGPFAGLTPLVTSDSDADFYDALSVNYYGSTQQAGQIINFYQRGLLLGTSVSPRDMTTYTNEMWLKDAITVELLNLFVGVSQIPANEQGRGLLLTSIQDPINTAVSNGTISVDKTLTTAQKQFISSVTNDPEAWYQVQSIGYWVDCQIIASTGSPVEYSAAFTLVYSKDDVIRFVSGRDILI